MRMFTRYLCLSAIALWPTAFGELQNVEIGGKIEIYGAWYSNAFEPSGGTERIPIFFLPNRPIGPYNTVSGFRTGDGGNNSSFWEQRTRLHVDADFTNEVKAFIELDSIDGWGQDFRSDYRSGADFRANSNDDIEIYQAFINVDQIFGLPAQLRIGRQELEFGSGWLMGSDPGPDPFVGMSFDALRLTVGDETMRVDAWMSKLAERGASEEDGDVDFYGVYGTWTLGDSNRGVLPHSFQQMLFPMHMVYGMYDAFMRNGPFRGRTAPATENLQFEAYYMYLRDGGSLNDSNFPAPIEWMEDLVDVDDYDATQLHTAGGRGSGTWNGFDWEVEAAYQWGDADSTGFLFKPAGQVYGDDDAKWDSWAGHFEVGWTSQLPWATRLYLGGAYYGGDDNRSISFLEWLNPFDRPDASVSFNRLFTSWREDAFIDGSGMSNFWKGYLGANAYPSERVELGLTLAYLEVLEAFDSPAAVTLGGWKVPLAPALPFWTEGGSKDLGWQTSLWATYAYTDNLTFEVGWSHWFVGDAIGEGVVFTDEYNLRNVGGRGDDDQDYVYFLTTIAF
ncbi:MAG: alginate export family protein [Candidatus Hydrogenedentes bacterium]|nr:alginate export family protein [Candidatus Hydrogenedentota bacterium]